MANVLYKNTNKKLIKMILEEALEHQSIQEVVKETLLSFLSRNVPFTSYCHQIIAGYYANELDALSESEKLTHLDTTKAVISKTTDIYLLNILFTNLLKLMSKQDKHDTIKELFNNFLEELDESLVLIFKKHFTVVLELLNYNTHKDTMIKLIEDAQTKLENIVFKEHHNYFSSHDVIEQNKLSLESSELPLNAKQNNSPVYTYLSDYEKSRKLLSNNHKLTLFGMLKEANAVVNNEDMVNKIDALCSIQ
ncbi:MAG: hypothetical protein P4M12_07090 [Gammaproteobacteria bacterium]|nr:hypothetical protein [Gammaproteobacteria bacterium]